MLTPTDGTELVSLITFSPRERNPTEKSLAENRNPRLEKVCTRFGKPTEPNLADDNPLVKAEKALRYKDSQLKAQEGVSKMVDIEALLILICVRRGT